MKQGFFTAKQTQSKTRPDGRVLTCVSCGLYKNADHPKLKPFGNGRKHIMVIGSFPTDAEDRRGQFFQSAGARVLQKSLAAQGVDLFEDCTLLYALNCTPGEGTPSPHSIACCRKIVMKAIDEYKPHIIILLGMLAVSSVIGGRWKKNMGKIEQWRGWVIPDQDFMAWVCPILDPLAVVKGDQQVLTVWEQDITRILEKIHVPVPKWNKPKIDVIEDLSVLSKIQSDMVSIDYETTGLKPHAPGHRIVCASVADSVDHAYTFLMPSSKRGRQPFIDLLQNERVDKMAHNMKFEENWSVVRLYTPVKGWLWDSMLAAHQLDNRPDITSLKFQTYIQFGLVDYASEVTPYLQADESSANNMNNVLTLINDVPGGKDKLLEYCGMDTITEYRLALQQMDLIGYDFLPF